MTSVYDIRCDRCGESGSIQRMDIKDGLCIYCREELESLESKGSKTEKGTRTPISKEQHTALAEAFRAYFEKIYDGMKSPAMREVVFGHWEAILKRVCLVLKNDNPDFDRKQFFHDCGLPTEKL